MSFFQKTTIFMVVMTVGPLFAMESDIAVFNQWSTSPKTIVKKKELESIGRVVDSSDGSLCNRDRKIHYEFYELLSAHNIKQKFTTEQLRYLPYVVSVFVASTLPSAFDCRINEDNVQFNQFAKEFNGKMEHLSGTTGKHYYLNVHVPLQQELTYDPNIFFLIKTGLLLFSVSPSFRYLRQNCVSSFKQERIDKFCGNLLRMVITAATFACLADYIASQSHDQPLVGAVCLTGMYALMCCCYNAIRTNVVHSGKTSLKKLPVVLRRPDIRIV